MGANHAVERTNLYDRLTKAGEETSVLQQRLRAYTGKREPQGKQSALAHALADAAAAQAATAHHAAAAQRAAAAHAASHAAAHGLTDSSPVATLSFTSPPANRTVRSPTRRESPG